MNLIECEVADDEPPGKRKDLSCFTKNVYLVSLMPHQNKPGWRLSIFVKSPGIKGLEY